MTAYLIVYGQDPTDRLAAYSFPDRIAARLASTPSGGNLTPGVPPGSYAGGCAYVVEKEADVTFSGQLLIDVFNGLTDSGVKKFESRAVGVKRLMSVLPQVAAPAPVTTNEEIKMSDAATTETAAPKRGKATDGKPADAQVFRAGKVRANTDRHRIMTMMDGTRTADQIGAEMNFSKPNYALSHFYCLARDCGVGYAFDDAGLVTALYPEGEGLDTAIAEPVEKKAKAPRQSKGDAAVAAA